jgi:glycosyltransferase involved in cell wall biosynthesis
LIKVLLVTGSYPPLRCGVGDYTASLAQSLRDTGQARVAILTGDPGARAQPGIEMILIRGWSLARALEALRAATEWKADIVHVQFPTQGYRSGWLPWALPLLLRLAGLRVAQTWHEFMPMGSYLFSLLLCLATGPVIVVRPNYFQGSPFWYRWILAGRKITHIPNASSIPRAQLTAGERSELHAKLAVGQSRVIAYFGYANPNKGVETLFDVADPARDRLVLVCELHESNAYQRMILDRSRAGPWSGKVTVTGYLPADEVAKVLAASDAVVYPYPSGGGEWNTALHAATAQGVFLLATSLAREGYDPDGNIHYCRPGDIVGMRLALAARLGHRIVPPRDVASGWAQIAKAHLRVFGQMQA